MPNRHDMTQNTIYAVFLGMAAVLIAMGIFFTPSLHELWESYRLFLTHPSILEFDGLKQAGNFGTAFVNAGVLLLVILLVYRLTDTELQGVHIAAAMMVMGFAFYGKNLLNIWFPIIGVFLRTLRRGRPLSSVTAMAGFSTAMAPVFSVIAFGTDALIPGSALAIGIGALTGILSGILFASMLSYLPSLHHGYELFNAGFAAGLATIAINCALKAFGIGHDRFPYAETDYITGSNAVLMPLMLILFGYLIVAGVLLGGGKQYREMFLYRSKGGNYVEKFGFASCLINMGEVGLACLLYVLLTGGQLCGPVFACIWTAAGFAMNGVSVRMLTPIFVGAYLTAFVTGGTAALFAGETFLAAALAKAGSRGMLQAAIFGCGLAPIAGRKGTLAGIFAAAAHCILVTNTGILHGWMSLYNNGLSLSLIATFLYPAYSRIGRKASERKEAAAVQQRTEAQSDPQQ